ncbi:PLD nuclease N-terminal domain-containing protein [Nesterenkonia sp. LB17]|uniref:PLD nuclease N-terminal domain-containing protein n=1 Tax=unclassified Nesterenkonia TaxID=2629769 RepID=UPI001F4D290E|nr:MULTISPECIES: PLD nuclease N-terminal domain-containing protein [unclassified Nesterenkonia]MCH8559128.1 PLD nuclease N-terminal domain-containing protein [Nesterenkonia sp. DZ6]MCH8563042.1 PLD nuclease N-terminal domain-containing protein [Nesterenkonia sp. YGD6]MCH8565142.1 PLD nuclease N-terminal domain-containing protein [Nesterenkonia sp. LB17]MCH8571463.1 PLD nuclease N-terminal domain-containing protein [Nesterenkonia sp. AY15]
MKKKTVIKKHPVKDARKSPKKQWKDMSPGRRAGTMVFSIVQISLAVAAWVDLARRPANQVNGKKGIWAAIIAVNYVGPISYFLKGRRTD